MPSWKGAPKKMPPAKKRASQSWSIPRPPQSLTTTWAQRLNSPRVRLSTTTPFRELAASSKRLVARVEATQLGTWCTTTTGRTTRYRMCLKTMVTTMFPNSKSQSLINSLLKCKRRHHLVSFNLSNFNSWEIVETDLAGSETIGKPCWPEGR